LINQEGVLEMINLMFHLLDLMVAGIMADPVTLVDRGNLVRRLHAHRNLVRRPDRPDLLDLLERPDPKVHQDPKVHWDQQDLEDQQDRQDRPDNKAPQEPLELQDQPDRQEPPERLVPPVHKENRDLLV
jgi:hypothetical protein